MNREQMEINRGSSSEIRRLENELKDTQVAFDLFQAADHILFFLFNFVWYIYYYLVHKILLV